MKMGGNGQKWAKNEQRSPKNERKWAKNERKRWKMSEKWAKMSKNERRWAKNERKMSEKCAKNERKMCKKKKKSKIKSQNVKMSKKINQKRPPKPPKQPPTPQIWHQNDRHHTLRPTVPISSRQHHARLRHSAQKAAALGGIHGTPGVSMGKKKKIFSFFGYIFIYI
jgi:hypothetical protein